MNRSMTVAEAEAPGPVLYRTPPMWRWPLPDLVRFWGVVGLFPAFNVWMVASGPSISLPAVTLLIALIAAVVVFGATETVTVVVTPTSVLSRSYLRSWFGRGYRAVDLGPRSCFVRTRRGRGCLWVGCGPRDSQGQMRTGQFTPDLDRLRASLSTVGVRVAGWRAT